MKKRNPYAVLLDTVSIQQYIFASGRLRENTGASFLVENVFDEYLIEALRKVFPQYKEGKLKQWEEDPEKILIRDEAVPWEIGYIGGGNALLFFQEESGGKKFIEAWTTSLLLKTPGMTTAVAGLEIDPDDFAGDKEKIFKTLQQNRNRFIPQTVIPRFGITAECPESGFSQETYNRVGDKERHQWVSSVMDARINCSEKAKKELEKEYKEILADGFCFTDQLEQLGHRKHKESHIAIVHLDGNSMAHRFNETKTLPIMRKLSRDVKRATRKSFAMLLQHIIDNFPMIQETLGYDGDKKNDFPKSGHKIILPIRPILMGGDDITFVCAGKLGIYFAQLYLQFFSRQEVEDQIPLSACAGIAITKTKFPFYRGYQLAEQLCENAKTQRRAIDCSNGEESHTSWLDFHIALGGVSGKIDEIRDYHYRSAARNLLFRPFCIDPRHDDRDFHSFVQQTQTFQQRLPKNKRMQLREVLTQGETASKTFALELVARGIVLPDIHNSGYHQDLWKEKQTPYFDMIELCEYYPFFESSNPQEQEVEG